MNRVRSSVAPMTTPEPTDDPQAFARAFEEAFQQTYLRFHRRDGKRSQMSGASRAVLLHLAHAGPLTVGEAAKHLDRAQSVMSDIVTQLESKDLLAREPDPHDRRRTLVWLTPAGFDALDRERQVLSTELIARAAATLSAEDRVALVGTLHALNEGARP